MMNRTVKKNLVMFIVFAMCISLFFSVKPLAVNANSEANAAVSSSDGCRWVEINNGLTDADISSLAIDPKNTQIIYAGTDGNGVFKSTDGGASWSKAGLTDADISSLAIDPKNTQTIYAGTWGSGIFKSTDGGASWNGVNNGLTGTHISSLAIDPANTQIIYAGTNSDEVFKSTNGGTSWNEIGSINTRVESLAIDPTNTQIIYAGGTWGGVFKSIDGGASWNGVNNGLINTDVNSLAIDPKNTQIIYAGTDNGVFKSIDGGINWNETELTNAYIWSLAIDPKNTQIIYAGTDSDVFKSTNGSINWSKAGLTDADISSLAIDPKNTQIIYAGTDNGVFKYTCPPSAPLNLKSNASAFSIVLSWSPSTQGTYPIAGYAIYRDTENEGKDLSKLIATVDANTTTYIDKNVQYNTTYCYYVKAFDNQTPANYSEPSIEVKVELTDTAPPAVTVFYPIDGITVNSSFIAVKGTVTDTESGIESLTVNGNNVTVNSDGSFSTSVFLAEGKNTITIIAIDKAGNKTAKTVAVTYKPQIVIVLHPGSPYMTVNGVKQEIDPGRGTKPVIVPKWGRTVVPIRAIVEALGGTISWNGKERKVTINFNDTVIELWIDNPKAKVNGEIKWIDSNNHDVKPIIVNSRTMLPLRFVAESLGCKVDWNGTTRTITITYGG